MLAVSNAYGNNSSDWERCILLRFDVSSLSKYLIVTSATLFLYYYDFDDTDPVGRVLSVQKITTEDWTDENTTWETRPSNTSANVSSAQVPSSFGWMSWDVTTEVNSIVHDQASYDGWQIADTNRWDAENVPISKFKSKETETQYIPYLAIEYYAPLTVLTTGPYEGYIAETIPMNAYYLSEGTPPYSWSWDFGDGNSSTNKTTSPVYTRPGTYSVTVRLIDAEGSSTTATTTVTVRIKPDDAPQITITHPENGLYFRNKKIFSLSKPWIIGPIEIIADVIAYDAITKVEFYLDNELKQIDSTVPYSWQWNEKTTSGRHTLTVYVFDRSGRIGIDQQILGKIF
jgi:PKD repeat protein